MMTVQLASRLPLRCTKCDHTDQIEKEGDEIHCCTCGNYAFVGKPTRWVFVEKEIKKEEKRMDTVGTKCERDGCEEPTAASKLCSGHFLETYGISVAEYRENKRYTTESAAKVAARVKGLPVEKPEKKPAKVETKHPETKAPEWHDGGVIDLPIAEVTVGQTPIVCLLSVELVDALTKKAKAEYRNPEQQAAYMLDRALRGEA